MKEPKIKKLTLKELLEEIHKHNELNNVTSQYGDKNPLTCVIVFKNESWPKRTKTSVTLLSLRTPSATSRSSPFAKVTTCSAATTKVP